MPISAAISAKRATPENRLSVPARRVALKMGWRRRCGSVAAPLRGCVLAAPCRHPILNATNDKLFRRQDTSRKERTKKLLLLQFKPTGSSCDVDRRCLERRSVVCPERDLVWSASEDRGAKQTSNAQRSTFNVQLKPWSEKMHAKGSYFFVCLSVGVLIPFH